MNESNTVPDPIAWMNMLAGWIRSSQYDEDAALNVIERAKTETVDLEQRLAAAEAERDALQAELATLRAQVAAAKVEGMRESLELSLHCGEQRTTYEEELAERIREGSKS